MSKMEIKMNGLETLWSSKFFNWEKFIVVYQDDETAPPISHDMLQQGFESLGTLVTLYKAIPRMEKMPEGLKYQRKPGQYLAPVQLMTQQLPLQGDQQTPGEKEQFFFVFAGYLPALEVYQTHLTACFANKEELETRRVKSILEVPIGGLFAIKMNDEKYARVRIVAINLRSKTMKHWAVDLGSFGTSTPDVLYHLNTNCLRLDMLVIPGIFEQDPTLPQFKGFERKTYCMAFVREPKLKFDFAPRKITLCSSN